jgi:hypothetical protein
MNKPTTQRAQYAVLVSEISKHRNLIREHTYALRDAEMSLVRELVNARRFDLLKPTSFALGILKREIQDNDNNRGPIVAVAE